jgi:transcriptional regulator with XRE-family HTH domain
LKGYYYILYSSYSPTELCRAVAERARAVRLSLGMRQRDLAERAGVPLPTLKRFETTGRAGFETVVRIALALGAEREFEALFPPRDARSLDEILATQKQRVRARRSR